MYIDTITPVIRFCQTHNCFHALAVFLSSTTDSLIIISKDNDDLRNRIATATEESYIFKIYSQTELYRKILGRDIEIATVFSHVVTLFDRIRIAPRILSAIEPIKIYNQQTPASMEAPDTIRRKYEISMLFCDIADLRQFISKTFIPLCRVIKTHLREVQYWIDWQYKTKISDRDILITFIIQSPDKEVILRKLQLYLYENVSELQLYRVRIPFERPSNYIDNLPCEVRRKTYDILCRFSEESLIMFSQENIGDSRKITLFTYYYLIAAKNYFLSKNEFIKANGQLLDIMVNESISPFTKSLLNHDGISEAKDKILWEYKRQSDKNKIVLSANYGTLIRDWNSYPDEEDSTDESLSALVDIRNLLNPSLSENENDLSSYFHTFFEKLAGCMDLPPFYKGYIPYSINYLTK